MGLGTGRRRRLTVLEDLEKSDPKRYAELLELRRHHPQKYRKALRTIGKKLGLNIRIGGRGAIPGPHPGRATDPDLSMSGPQRSTVPETPDTVHPISADAKKNDGKKRRKKAESEDTAS
jgi:hypothetical protein